MFKLGTQDVNKIMLGSIEVCSPTTPPPDNLIPPYYDYKIDPMLEADSYYYLYDINSGNYNGKLVNDTGGYWTSDEVNNRIDKDNGLIDLSGGYEIRCVDFRPTANDTFFIQGFINTVFGSSYDGYAIDAKGDGTCDIYLSDETLYFTTYQTGAAYTPDVDASGNYIISENYPSVITPPLRKEQK